MCCAGPYAAPTSSLCRRVPGIQRKCICLLQQTSLKKPSRARTCFSLDISEAPSRHGELNSTENWPPPHGRTLSDCIATASTVRSRVLEHTRPGTPHVAGNGRSRPTGGRKPLWPSSACRGRPLRLPPCHRGLRPAAS